MVSFEIFVKAMPPSLLELKVLPSFCFAFKIPDNVAASNNYIYIFFFNYETFISIWILFCIVVLGYVQRFQTMKSSEYVPSRYSLFHAIVVKSQKKSL